MLRWIHLCVILCLCIGVSSITAQDAEPTPEATPEATAADPLELIPFTLIEQGLHGVRPLAWDELRPGTFRATTGEAALFHAVTGDAVPQALERYLLPFGVRELPSVAETLESGDLTWELRTITVENPESGGELIFWIATATPDRTYVVFLQAAPQQIEALREAVFLPAVEAFGQPMPDITESLGYLRMESVTIGTMGLVTLIPVDFEEKVDVDFAIESPNQLDNDAEFRPSDDSEVADQYALSAIYLQYLNVFPDDERRLDDIIANYNDNWSGVSAGRITTLDGSGLVWEIWQRTEENLGVRSFSAQALLPSGEERLRYTFNIILDDEILNRNPTEQPLLDMLLYPMLHYTQFLSTRDLNTFEDVDDPDNNH